MNSGGPGTSLLELHSGYDILCRYCCCIRIVYIALEKSGAYSFCSRACFGRVKGVVHDVSVSNPLFKAPVRTHRARGSKAFRVAWRSVSGTQFRELCDLCHLVIGC